MTETSCLDRLRRSRLRAFPPHGGPVTGGIADLTRTTSKDQDHPTIDDESGLRLSTPYATPLQDLSIISVICGIFGFNTQEYQINPNRYRALNRRISAISPVFVGIHCRALPTIHLAIKSHQG
jgi:hypothetical protein